MLMARKVFFLTYAFPPIGGVAALRSLKFARYLTEFGWDVTVFHAGPGSMHEPDLALLREVPPGVKAIPVRTLEGASIRKRLASSKGGRFLMYRLLPLLPVDERVGWVPGLIAAVRAEVAARGKPDVIFSSAGPNSVNVAGLYFRRQGYRWVADFRDTWTRNPYASFPTPLHRALSERLETDTLARANAIVTTTNTWTDEFQTRRPTGLHPVVCIRNGYDETDFSEHPEPIQDKWTLAWVGSAYGNIDPTPILQALQRLIQTQRIPGEQVRVVQAGKGRINYPPEAGFEVKVVGFVSHAEAVSWMQRSHALLLALDVAGLANARLYEYIRAGNPIVAVGDPREEAARLIDEAQAGQVFPAENEAALEAFLLTLYQRWASSPNGKQEPAAARRVPAFERREQAKQLATLFEEIIAREPTP